MSKPLPPTTPDPNSPSQYQRDIYSNLRNPIFSTKPSEWERLASLKVPAENYGYVYGSASSGATHAANRSAFDRYRLRPRMLVDATRRDLSVDLFGVKLHTPILVAPVGVQNIMHEDGEEATARACKELQIPMVLSTAATRSIETIAEANGEGSHRWYQLYWPKPETENITISLLDRAKKQGFKVLVVTLDTFQIGWRPTDLDTSYLPFIWGEGCQVGHSDPEFEKLYAAQRAADTRSAAEKLKEAFAMLRRPGSVFGALKVLANASTMKRSQSWLEVMCSGRYRKWEDLAILQKHWDGPIVLKGIQTVEDAHLAIQHGMQGIIVSNHGGRQLDGAVASLDALAEIGSDEKVKASGITILFDSGIRTGADIVKAIALGAKAVLIGRPYMYGLAIAGEDGVKHVLRCIAADLDSTVANLGKTNLREVSRADLQIWEKAKI